MDDSIPERRGADLPAFGLVDEEVAVWAGRVGVVTEFPLEVDQSVGDGVGEPGRGRAAGVMRGRERLYRSP